MTPLKQYTSRAEMIADHKARQERLGLDLLAGIRSRQAERRERQRLERVRLLERERREQERLERERAERQQRRAQQWFWAAWSSLEHMPQAEPEIGVRQIKVADIIAATCVLFDIPRIDLLSHRRTAEIVFPRQLAMYVAKKRTLRSLPDIARRFGGRDHTTCLHAVRKIGALVEFDPYIAAHIEAIERELGIYQTRDERAAA